MDDGKRFYERPVFWPRLIGGIFLLSFIIAFRSEILLFLRVLQVIIQYILKFFTYRPVSILPADTPQALLILSVNLIFYLGIYFIILKWISFFVLPAKAGVERQMVYGRLLDYVLGIHGPAVFVKNGKLVARKAEESVEEEGKARFASLALVDLASAIVVEGRSRPPKLALPDKPVPKGELALPIRVLGPGIGFLRSGERIRGSVDLRKQFRVAKGVRGYTSDGIELKTNVFVIFTLGQPSDVVTVFETKEHAICVMSIDRETRKISISDKIDPADAAEIRSNIQLQKPNLDNDMTPDTLSSNRPPFAYQADHIISAVISQPRNAKDGKLEKWTDLPAQVAVSTLLDELSRISYDELYSLESYETACYLYDTFKPEFRRKVKELGVLAYQFVQRKDGKTPQEGDIFNKDKFIFWNATELKNSKPIRERGIKVIECGFSDFIPSDSSIPDQRFDTWRAKQQKEVELSNAEYDLEIMRETNHARAHAQREIIYNLSQIFKLPGYTQDAMAIRIFQALESAAANPATNRLLPRDTMDMLKSFQRLLFPPGRDEQAPDGQSSDGPRQES